MQAEQVLAAVDVQAEHPIEQAFKLLKKIIPVQLLLELKNPESHVALQVFIYKT